MIEIKDLAFSYSKRGNAHALKDISLKLESGKIYGLLGENGVGKTTLLTLMCGLKKPDTGTILIDGFKPYDRKPSFLSSIFYLPDEVSQVPLKAIDYAVLHGRLRENFSLNIFKELMEIFENDTNKRMDKMSLGQLKKTYISFAIACQTKYLLMDEPTNGLDIPSKSQLRNILTKYTRKDSTIVISTHQVKDLENVIDPIIILECHEVLVNASLQRISEKLYFDYGIESKPGCLYSEFTPGGYIQVFINIDNQESKVNIEAFFNTAHNHKDLIKDIFAQ